MFSGFMTTLSVFLVLIMQTVVADGKDRGKMIKQLWQRKLTVEVA